jgi:hypothetical protein
MVTLSLQIVVRVTRLDWANFRLLGDCFLWAVLWNMKMMPWFLGYFFFGKSYKKLLAKIGLGYILGDFFTNSSGHPDRSLHRFHFSSFLTSVNFSTCDSTYDSLLLCTLYSFLLRFFFIFLFFKCTYRVWKHFMANFTKAKITILGALYDSWTRVARWFLGPNIPKWKQLYQMTTNYTKWP